MAAVVYYPVRDAGQGCEPASWAETVAATHQRALESVAFQRNGANRVARECAVPVARPVARGRGDVRHHMSSGFQR